MDCFDKFIKILESSAEKNGGDKPLTINHLLNIARLSKKLVDEEEIEMEERLEEGYDELFNDMHKYGTD